MNPENAEKARDIFKGIKSAAKDLKNTEVVICPPFVYLSDLEKINGSTGSPQVIMGAQDVFWEKSGSFTGEISSNMLKKEGEAYVIIGHSERRELGETDEVISKKIKTALMTGLRVILCIGEKVRDDHGEYLHFLRSQIVNSLGKLPKRYLSKLVMAYEPVWAIGKEEAMRVSDLHEMTIYIKKVLVEIYGQEKGLPVPILYGGSVNHNNAKELISSGEVQGLLVGRESLNSKKFGELLKNIDSIV